MVDTTAESDISISKMPDGDRKMLEVIACSVTDAIDAEKGGANRLEIVRDLKRGGLTPSYELVKEIKGLSICRCESCCVRLIAVKRVT